MAKKDDPVSKGLRDIELRLLELNQRLDALGAPKANTTPPEEKYQGPRRHRYRPQESMKAFSFRVTASPTRKSLQTVVLTRTVKGVNELDARVTLAQELKSEEGLYLGVVLSVVEVEL